jgi:hypothetical protein
MTGIAGAACDAENGIGDVPPECSLECPPGTKLLNFNSETFAEDLNNGAFLLAEQDCETRCAPVTPCVRPNVPVVTATTYECQGLPGLSDIEPPAETDFAWMSVWDEQAVQP